MKDYSTAYAAAIFELSAEDGSTERIFEEMKELSAVVKQCPELSEVMTSPEFSRDERLDIVSDMLRGKTDELFFKFISLLADEGRFDSIDEIFESFKRLWYDKKGIAEAFVTTAAPLGDAAAARLKARLEQKYGKQIILISSIDPSIIGGVSVRIGDELIDGSVKGQLARAAKAVRE